MNCADVAGSGMKKNRWEDNLFELIQRTATDLPADVENALKRAQRLEKRRSHAYWALSSMLESIKLARERQAPLCEDSGTLIFYFSVPLGFDTNALTAHARGAVTRATRAGLLRQNTLDSISGAPYPTNVAHAAPVMYVQQGARKTVDVRLIMKDGACENEGRQYALPDAALEADRDLAGARRCILDAVWQAQDSGCGPFALGVCVGGDRSTGFEHSKAQYLRRVGARSRTRALAALETRILKESRALGIGPMGLGGVTSVLGIGIDAISRVPSSFYVTVSVMSWTFRRRGVLLGPEGGVHRWLY